MKSVMIVLATILIITIGGCASVDVSQLPQISNNGVLFRLYAPGAEAVSLIGTFNNWNSSQHKMSSTDGKNWQVRISLSSGRYSYTFLVNGKAIIPPEAYFYEQDRFGGKNGVIIIR